MLLSIIALVLLTVCVVSALKYARLWKTLNLIPGPTCLPLVGDTTAMKTKTDEYFQLVNEYCRTFNQAGIIRVWFGPICALYVLTARTVEELLNSSKHLEKGFYYHFLDAWLGDGLLLSTGEKWYKRRKLITPTFHFKILEEFMPVFNEQATILVRNLAKIADVGAELVDVQPIMSHCTLDIICEAAMGVSVHAQDDPNSAYVRAVCRSNELFLERWQRPWLWPNFLHNMSSLARESAQCVNILHGFTKKVISDRKAKVKSSDEDSTKSEVDKSCSGSTRKRRRLAFLDMLLEEAKNNPSFKDKDIQEEVDTFMFEGHDTLASGAVFSLYMLGCHPEVQSKVQHEIDSVLGNGDSDREVTMEDINQLTYTDCFIKETLRLYPPLPWFGRVTSEPCTIGGCDIPTGSIVTVMVSKLHRDPEFFPDPEKFDPERWLDDKMSSRHPFCYLPFSAGIRNCTGQRFALLELKTILCHILRQYHINCSVKPQHITLTAFTTLKPLKPVLMQLTKRLRNVSS